MFTVALTGGIGCGKSTVCELFSRHSIAIVDTDKIARELVKPQQAAFLEIVSYFGPDICQENGELDRKSLSHKVFTDEVSRKQLEAILHPKIRQCVSDTLSSLSTDYAIVVIPLLIETSQQSQYDRVLVIDCDEEQQIQRVQNRDQRSLSEIKAIIESQVTRQQRLEHADDVINNNLNENCLPKQVEQLHRHYLSLANA